MDDQRIAVLGFSDGASMGLSLALNNHSIFQAAMVWAARVFPAAACGGPGRRVQNYGAREGPPSAFPMRRARGWARGTRDGRARPVGFELSIWRPGLFYRPMVLCL